MAWGSCSPGTKKVAEDDRIKRRAPRIQPFVAPCRVLDGPRQFAGYLTDLSIGGAQVSVGVRPPEPGTSVVLQVRLGGRFSATRLPSEVRWARLQEAENTYSFGVAFKDLTPAEQETLEAALKEFRKRAAELA